MENENVTILYQTENGYIIKCKCCNEVHVSYQTILLKLAPKQFAAFKNCIDNIDTARTCACNHVNNKRFQLATHSEVTMSFTAEEIIELRDLLEQADVCLKVNDLCDDLPN